MAPGCANRAVFPTAEVAHYASMPEANWVGWALAVVAAVALLVWAVNEMRHPERCPECGAYRGSVHKPRCTYPDRGRRV